MKVLVVLRCGDSSLHPNWVNNDANFDVVLSYFGDCIKYNQENIKFIHYFKGSKWEGLYDFFKTHYDLWASYDYIWLPDDDLDSTTNNINEYFKLNDEFKFSLSQPALTHKSFFSHQITLQVSNFYYRETNFVEVMAPCFSIDAFKDCWETFSANKSGWGLDFLWPNLLLGKKIGIIDATPIYHTRAVGSAGNGTGSKNTSPFEEKKLLITKYNIKEQINCLSGLLKNNEILNKTELLQNILYGSAPMLFENKHNVNEIYNEIFPEIKKEKPVSKKFWRIKK